MNFNDKEIRLAGVIGDPIRHSKSPLIHNHWIKKNNLSCFYIPIKISRGDLEKKITYLRELGFAGLNVTVPHKIEALSIANEKTEEAQKLGAANTLYFENNLIIADNTDAFGFKNSILRNFPFYNFKKQKVLIFGAGGAARAVISVFIKEKAFEIRLINRNYENAKTLKKQLSDNINIFDWKDHTNAISGATTVVNTTSLGNLGCNPFPYDLQGVNRNAIAIDLVYNPIETSFMKKAKKENIKSINGLDMLIYQAKQGFSRWFNKKPVYSKELKDLLVSSLTRI